MAKLSQEKILSELERCEKDPVYFMRNYIKVIHPIRGEVPFDLYRFQERIVKEYETHRFNILRKFRQAGATTISCAYALWLVIFNEQKNIMVVSIGDRESTDFLRRVVLMYRGLPAWMRPKVKEKNKHVLELSTGSRIRSQPAGAGRSEAVSLLIVDEAAFVEGMDGFWAAIYPTLSTGGNAIVLSTVNGVANLYYRLWKGATDKTNNFNAIDIAWQEHPEYNKPGWRETTIANMPSYKQWLQEYECEFLGTGDTLLDRITLRRLHDNVSKEFCARNLEALRIFKEPKHYYQYILSVDPALGRELDYSAFHVINVYTGEQEAEFYSNKFALQDFGDIINEIGSYYNFASVIIERNVVGIPLIEYLFNKLEYENIWLDERNDMGILNTQKTRDTLLANMEYYLRESKLKINSMRTVEELMAFIIDENGRLKAEEGYHDDLVMSLATAVEALRQIYLTTPIEDFHFDDNVVDNPIIPILYSKYTDDEKEMYDTSWILK